MILNVCLYGKSSFKHSKMIDENFCRHCTQEGCRYAGQPTTRERLDMSTYERDEFEKHVKDARAATQEARAEVDKLNADLNELLAERCELRKENERMKREMIELKARMYDLMTAGE